MNELLLTGAFKYNTDQLNQIKQLDYNITYLENELEELDLDFSKFTHVVCNSLFLYNDITQFKSLKMIQVTSSGLDRLPLDYIIKKEIILKSANDIYSNPIAEFVITKILDIYKNTYTFYEQQKNKIWLKHKNLDELSNKKIAIVGYGNIGRNLAKKLKSFDAKIFAVGRRYNIDENVDEFIYSNEFDQNINKFDIIILTLPLNDNTKGYITYNTLLNMKENAILVNVSRGQIINTSDLYKYLLLNPKVHIILDVFENEPLNKDDDLWKYSNVYITPHNSYASINNNEKLYNLIYNNLRQYNKL